jgi:diacylglycerol kinase family enzyme
MELAEFAGAMAEICSHTQIMPGRPLFWTIIANPTAGGFSIRSRWKRGYAMLMEAVKRAGALPPRPEAGPSRTAREADRASGGPGNRGLVPTTGRGHAGNITAALMDEAASTAAYPPEKVPFYLLITAGGDGTSLEVQEVLYNTPGTVRKNCAILRLPMGTGNDGADARELDAALSLLIDPVQIEYHRTLRLSTSTPGKGPFPAFNILSVGLDAFVTHMTNKIKGNLPGDFYKLWVDFASLFYDRLYKVGPMEVAVYDDAGRRIEAFTEDVLLLAVGASGRRTYGSNKRILPDDRNVCVVRQMPLLRKVALKGLFTTGEHITKPESRLFTAGRVEFRGQYPILAQMDGETVLLRPEDYPATIELTEPVIPVLRRPAVPGSGAAGV